MFSSNSCWLFPSSCCTSGGLESETDYSYTGHKQKCDFTNRKVAAYINSSVELPKDERGKRSKTHWLVSMVCFKDRTSLRWTFSFHVFFFVFLLRDRSLAGREWTHLCGFECFCNAGETFYLTVSTINGWLFWFLALLLHIFCVPVVDDVLFHTYTLRGRKKNKTNIWKGVARSKSRINSLPGALDQFSYYTNTSIIVLFPL